MCAVVEEVKPEVVSFHFGLPAPDLVDRLKTARHQDLVVCDKCQGSKMAGVARLRCHYRSGHRGGRTPRHVSRNEHRDSTGLFALLPQVGDAVSVPVIAAGGIADARGVVAAFALGASGVQLGTAYLFCPEANVSPLYLRALQQAADNKRP